MSKEEVFELIRKKKAELDKPLEIDPRIEHCQQWADVHKYVKLDDFSKIDVYELLVYLLPVVLDIKDIETTNHIAEIFQNFFYPCSTEDVIGFVNVAADIYASGEIDKVISMLDAPNEEESEKIADTIENLDEQLILHLRKNGGYDLDDEIGSDFSTLLVVLKNHYEAFFNILVVIAAHKCVCEKYSEVDDIIEKHKDLFRSKESRKKAEKYKKKLFKLDHAFNVVNSISSFVSQKRMEQKKALHSLEMKKSKIESVERMLKSALEKKEVTNAREIVSQVEDFELAVAILELIKKHNRVYYDELDREFNELSSNDETQYRALLHDFGIRSKDYDINKIMHLKLEDIRSILDDIVRKFSFDDDKALRILEFSDLERVQLINKYIANGYISIDYLSDNIELYNLNSKDIEVLGVNIDLLNSFNVNPYMFKNSINVLFGDSNILKSNLQLLKEYDLLKYFKTTSKYEFLLEKDLCIIIDKYIELGYESLLKEDLNILNFANIKRLDIIHMLNIPVDSLEELYDILYSKKFFMSDDSIDSYLLNVVDYHDRVNLNVTPEQLAEFSVSKRCYSFDGVLVSIPKVNRLLSKGVDLYDSVFSGMNVSEDEYNRVVNCLCQNCYGSR